MTIPMVAVVGRPNVGKSTLTNRIIGRRAAIVEERPGVTRDRVLYAAEWRGRPFLVVDTGGLQTDAADALAGKVSEVAKAAAAEADVVAFVVDATDGITTEDRAVADVVRRLGRPVVLVANKVDGARQEAAGPQDVAHVQTGLDGVRPAVDRQIVLDRKPRLLGAVVRRGAPRREFRERDDAEVLMSIRSILRGGAPIDPFIAREILNQISTSNTPQTERVEQLDGQNYDQLTNRETEILNLVAQGLTNREIAEQLFVSRYTVESHIKHIYRKLSVSKRTKAVSTARSLGIL